MSTMKLGLEDSCQCRVSTATRLQTDTLSTLGDPWEEVNEFSQPREHRNDTFTLRDKLPVAELSNEKRVLNCGSWVETVYAKRQPRPSEFEPPQLTAAMHKLPEGQADVVREMYHAIVNGQLAAAMHSAMHKCADRPINFKHEIHLASVRAQTALDEYLECHGCVHSSMEELIAYLDDHLQGVGTRHVPSDEIRQRVADNQQQLNHRSKAVKDAQLWLQTLRTQYQQEQENVEVNSNSHDAIEPESDDDTKSDISNTSSDVPTVVEEYFQAAREAFIEDERLAELENEYEDLVAASTRDRDGQEDPNAAVTNAVKAYRQKRQELGGLLGILHYRLHARREACLDQGIDPEHFRYRRLSHHNRHPLAESSGTP